MGCDFASDSHRVPGPSEVRERAGRRHGRQTDRRRDRHFHARRDRRQAPRRLTVQGVRPQLKLVDAKGNEIKPAGSDTPLTITFQIGSIIPVKDGQEVAPGDMLARMPMETSKTRDITGGLPRVAELFEARSPKDAGMLAEVTGTVSFGKDTKGKQRLVIKDMDGVSHEYLIPEGKSRDGHRRSGREQGRTDRRRPSRPPRYSSLVWCGSTYQVHHRRGPEVYRLQGVKINDKHIEVIVRQMLRRVTISHPGDSKVHYRRTSGARAELLAETTVSKPMARRPPSSITCCSGYHQGVVVYRFVHLSSLVPETTWVLTAAIMGKRMTCEV